MTATWATSHSAVEGRAQVRTWLFGILHHKVQDSHRSQARDEATDPIDDAFEARFDAKDNWIAPQAARVASARSDADAPTDLEKRVVRRLERHGS